MLDFAKFACGYLMISAFLFYFLSYYLIEISRFFVLFIGGFGYWIGQFFLIDQQGYSKKMSYLQLGISLLLAMCVFHWDFERVGFHLVLNALKCVTLIVLVQLMEELDSS